MKKTPTSMEKGSRIQMLDAAQDLETFLSAFKHTQIDIAVAFASKTEHLIQSVLANDNQVSLVIGTINCFSDPAFIEWCCQAATANRAHFDFAVDFRGGDSIHWKVYLIAPDMVVVGSPNLTVTGLSLRRDTAVVITNRRLYQTYLGLFAKIRRNPEVVTCESAKFNKLFAEYRRQHRELPPRPAKRASVQAAPSFRKWLGQDMAQTLPVFVWDRDLTRAEEQQYKKRVLPQIVATLPGNGSAKLYVIGCYEGRPNDPLYHGGDVVLTVKPNGAYVRFDKAEVVINIDGVWWLCGFASRRCPKPFALSPRLKQSIKQHARRWFDEDKALLDSNDLRQLEKTARTA